MRLPRRTRREGAAVPRTDAQAVHQPRRVPAGVPVAKRDAKSGPAQPTKRPSAKRRVFSRLRFGCVRLGLVVAGNAKASPRSKWNDDCRDRLFET